jgi:hypothetical protein
MKRVSGKEAALEFLLRSIAVTFVSSQGKAPREERVTKSKSQFGSELTFLSAEGHPRAGVAGRDGVGVAFQ